MGRRASDGEADHTVMAIDGPVTALGGLADRLADVRLVPLAAALVFQLLKICLMSQVWGRIVRAAYPAGRVARRDVLGPYLVGVGVGAVVPAKAGCVARAVLMRRRLPAASYDTLAMTIVVEALLGIVPLTLLAAAALATGVAPMPSGLPGLALPVPGAPALALAALATLVVAATALSSPVRGRVAVGFGRLRQGAAILGRGRALAAVLTGVMAAWALRLACIGAFLMAFGLDASPRTILLVVMVQMLSSLVPVAPNGAGAQQGLMVLALAGVAGADAILTFAIGMQAAIIAIDVVAGAIALAAMGAPWRALGDLRRPVDDPLPVPAA